MSDTILAETLHNEIINLEKERSGLAVQRAELDRRLAAIDTRLHAARQYLSTLEPGTRRMLPALAPNAPRPRARIRPATAERAPEPRQDIRRRAIQKRKARTLLDDLSADQLAALDEAGLTVEEIQTTKVPFIIGRTRLHPESKKATIIRATKAYLLKNNIASREELTRFLLNIGVLGGEKNPENSLSVVLSSAKEIFETEWIADGDVRFKGWFLTEQHAEGTM